MIRLRLYSLAFAIAFLGSAAFAHAQSELTLIIANSQTDVVKQQDGSKVIQCKIEGLNTAQEVQQFIAQLEQVEGIEDVTVGALNGAQRPGSLTFNKPVTGKTMPTHLKNANVMKVEVEGVEAEVENYWKVVRAMQAKAASQK